MAKHQDPRKGGRGQARRSAGTPQGGQFAAQSNDEPSITLPTQPGPPSGSDPYLAEPGTDGDVESALAETNESRLWHYVHHPSELMRLVAAQNPNLTEQMARELMSQQQPLGVRVNAASNHPVYASVLASADSDRFVRVFALDRRSDLPASARVSLGQDDRIWNLRRLAADAFALQGTRINPPRRFRNGPRA